MGRWGLDVFDEPRRRLKTPPAASTRRQGLQPLAGVKKKSPGFYSETFQKRLYETLTTRTVNHRNILRSLGFGPDRNREMELDL